MAFPLAALGLGALSAVGNTIGSIYSANSAAQAQRGANESNARIAADNRNFSSAQAQRQMDFQERMANTSHQRSVADLRAAGLNPMLAAMNGATAPAGAMGTAQAPTMEPVNTGEAVGAGIRGLSNSALSAAQIMQDFRAKDAQIAATRAAGVAALANAGSSDASALALKAKMPRYEAESRVAKARSKYDVKSAGYDAVVKRVLDALGGASDAASLKRLFQGGSSRARNLP